MADTSRTPDRKSTRLNSSHSQISYAVFCLKKKKKYHPVISLYYPQYIYSVFFIFFRHAPHSLIDFFFFFNDTATTEIYTLSLHDALPISQLLVSSPRKATTKKLSHLSSPRRTKNHCLLTKDGRHIPNPRSEEHTSELQSQSNLVCRLLLEKKKKIPSSHISILSTIHLLRFFYLF